MANRPVLFSGIQPSGHLHIGAYIGAIKNWLTLQDEYDCLFSIVDLHTITVRQNPQILHERCYEFLALYLACGLDPDKNIIFCQSHVPAHTQLTWILNCYTSMGDLSRMTQFKDKSKQHSANINVGLFDYPVLQAADILLYKTDIVPVGADQKQHVELTRDIAIKFNNLYGETFNIPRPFIVETAAGARVMGLQTPENKMSKSDTNENNTINLLDAPEVITKKCNRAVTDSDASVKFAESKPGVSNLLTIYAAVTNKSISQLEAEYMNSGYGKFKTDLAAAIIAFLEPIQKKYHELRHDETVLDKVLHDGAQRAIERATPMITKIYEVIGLATNISIL